jgi:hypothetical protein
VTFERFHKGTMRLMLETTQVSMYPTKCIA